MKISAHRLAALPVLLAGLAVGCVSGDASTRGGSPATRCRRWSYLLEQGDRDMKAGRWSAAAARYRKYFRRCPDTPQAVHARLQYARALEQLGRRRSAFDAYAELLETFPTAAPREEVLDRMLSLATAEAQQRHLRWLFGGFTEPESALPLLEKIISLGPGWPGAARAQLLLGDLHRRLHQYEEAAAAYQRLLSRFPDAPEAEDAAYGHAVCLYRLAERYPNDRRLLESAWSAVVYFLDRYPRSPRAESVQAFRRVLLRRRAQAEFEIARFYDRISRNPRAALEAYRQFVKKYPHSGWTPDARRRIQELETQLGEDGHETE